MSEYKKHKDPILILGLLRLIIHSTPMFFFLPLTILMDDHRDFNPFGGCRPGIDCPWYPDKHGKAHCTSSANFAGIYNLHESAEICCEEHFSALNVNSCVQNSSADVEAEEDLVQEKLARPRFYWPDLHGKKNCVFDSGYDVWMEEVSSFNLLFVYFK